MTLAPFRSRFQVDGIGDVAFGIRREPRDAGHVADWSMPSTTVTHMVPGAIPPIVVTDLISHGASQITWRLHLASRADYRKLAMMRGQAGTLTILAGLQSHRGTTVTVAGMVYEQLPETTLLAIDRAVRLVGPAVEVDATFQRVEDPATSAVVPLMLLNFQDVVPSGSPLATPPQLRTNTDLITVGMSGGVRSTSGQYPGAMGVRLNAVDSAFLFLSAHEVMSESGVIAVRARWRSNGTHDVIRLGNVGTDGVRIWRTSANRIEARAGSVTALTGGAGPVVANDTWTDIILRWAFGGLWLWVDGVLITTGTSAGNPGITGNQLIVGSNSGGTRGDIDVDAVATYGTMTGDRAAMLAGAWAWEWSTLVAG